MCVQFNFNTSYEKFRSEYTENQLILNKNLNVKMKRVAVSLLPFSLAALGGVSASAGESDIAKIKSEELDPLFKKLDGDSFDDIERDAVPVPDPGRTTKAAVEVGVAGETESVPVDYDAEAE